VNTGASAACFARSVANRTRHGTIRSAAVQAILISYFLTGPKERFKVVCNKARLVVKPPLIKPAIDALPRLDKDYDHFKDAMLNKHTIDNKVLNHFKAEMYMVLSEVEQLIAMTFLRFWQRSEARKLAQQRADFVAEITGI
jgi:hypothetical protein